MSTLPRRTGLVLGRWDQMLQGSMWVLEHFIDASLHKIIVALGLILIYLSPGAFNTCHFSRNKIHPPAIHSSLEEEILEK